MAKANKKSLKKTVCKTASKKIAVVKKASPVKAKKPAPKKADPKKVAVKKPAKAPVKKAPAKKAVVKKTKPKKAPAKKAIVKKPSPKKVSVKKFAAKAVVKKAPAKKTAAKAPVKKAVKIVKPALKVLPKTSVKADKQPPHPKVPAAKKAAPMKKVDIKEIISKKLGSKVSKKPAKLDVVEDVSAKDTGKRASAGIYFSMEDIASLLSGRSKSDDKSSVSSAGGNLLKKQSASAKAQAAPKRPMAAASISDILGFNPITETRAQFEEKDVPSKWKKYYKLLMEVKKRFAEVSADMTDVVAPAKEELTHEQAVQGMDAADIGSKNFERDMAYSLLSNEQAILEEIDAAIERMRNGTYGICEIINKPIPETRLLAIPWARCTIDGQRIKEAELKRQKAGSQRNPYGDIAEDLSDIEGIDENEE